MVKFLALSEAMACLSVFFCLRLLNPHALEHSVYEKSLQGACQTSQGEIWMLNMMQMDFDEAVPYTKRAD
jgi:hypothetical protein